MAQQSLLEKKLARAQRQVFGRLHTDPVLGLAARALGAALGGALLAGVRVRGHAMPVCLALCAALPCGLTGVCAYLGGAGMFVLLYGAPQALNVLAAGFLILTGQLLLRGLLPQDRRWFVPLGAATLYGLLEFLALLQAYFAPEQTLLFVLRTALLGVCSRVFSEALTRRSRPARLFLGWCLLAGSGAVSLPGSVPLGIVLATALSACCLGLPGALRIGAVCALALDLTGVCPIALSPAFCAAALLCAILPLRPRPLRTAVLLGCCGTALLTAQAQIPAFVGCVLGAAGSLLLPRALAQLLALDEQTADAAPPGLEEAATLLRRVQRVLTHTRPTDTPPQSAAVFDRAAELACRDCPGWQTCWETCAADTYLALSGAAGRILQRGAAHAEDLPPFFRTRCCRYEIFLSAIDQALDEQTARLQYHSRLAELRAVAAEQYACLAAFLHALAAPRPLLAPLPAFRPEVGFRACGVRGSSVCGDNAGSFTCGEWFYLYLCDGMGTGSAARQESQTAAALLTRLIQSGMDAQDALRMLNGVYLLRGDGGFSTVDLLQISLVSGEGFLHKWGGAPSYLRAGRRVFCLGAAAPPPGIDTQTAQLGQCIRLELQRGQTLLLVSDGADGEAAARVLREQTALSACALAAAVVAACAAPDDDRTAAVLTLRRTRQTESS